MFDAARAVQFLRSKAQQWNIDTDRIIVKGQSAGGCSALWINYHDDVSHVHLLGPCTVSTLQGVDTSDSYPALVSYQIKNLESKDPVERESSRVMAAVVESGQSTIDPAVLSKWLGTKG